MTDMLSVFAELGIALTGFTGIVLALGSGRRRHPLEGYRLTVLLLLSGAITLLAAAPLAVASLMEEAVLWRLACGLMALTSTAVAVLIAVPARRLGRVAPAVFPVWLVTLLVAGHLLNAGVQVTAAAGLIGPAGNFFAPGLVGFLVNALVQFGRMLRVPVFQGRSGGRSRQPIPEGQRHARQPRLHTA